MTMISTVLIALFAGGTAFATDLTNEVELRLDHPLASGEMVISVGQLGYEIDRISRGSSRLSTQDQRSLLETAMASLSFGNLEKTRALEDVYLWHLEDGHDYPFKNPWTSSVTLSDKFTRIYVSLKLLLLHESLHLDWQNRAVSRILPDLMYQSMRQDVLTYLTVANRYHLDTFERAVETLHDTPELMNSPAAREAYAEFSNRVRTDLMADVEATAVARTAAEKDRLYRLAPKALLITAMVLGVSQGPYLVQSGDFMPFVATGVVIAGASTYLKWLLKQRREARLNKIGRDLENTIVHCERTLGHAH